jgi:hypothetical protein
MGDYDADSSWQRALEYFVPGCTDEFRLFCENNIDLGVTGHGLRRQGESPRFNAALQQFGKLMNEGDTIAATKLLTAHFNQMIVAAETMIATNEAPRLSAEIEPWCKAMKLLALKGVATMKMLEALKSNRPEDFINSYLDYQKFDKHQLALRSRDFPGSIKAPNPVVATTFIVPFIKKSVAQYIDEYKKAYDYRLDVFPKQVVENGKYFIKVNGKYLTNEKENTPRTAPVFKEERDMIKPQRQEWIISLDTDTERYKIVNAQDNRYLNETGSFSAGNSTNPYDATWHTYTLQRGANGKFSIHTAGRAGKNFWMVTPDNDRVYNSGYLDENYRKMDEEGKCIFEFVPINEK